MELPSDFQEHFYTILTRFGHIVGSLFAKKGREIETNQTRRPRNKLQEQRICRHSEYALKEMHGGGVGRSPLEIERERERERERESWRRSGKESRQGEQQKPK